MVTTTAPVRIATCHTRANRLAVSARDSLLPLLVLHLVVWALYGSVALSGGLHDDMLEAYAWGKEFALGYYKHPPIFAWVAGAWFSLFPREDWCFQLLAATNATLGLLAIRALAGEFLGPVERRSAVLLAMLTPLYGVLAMKFNANSILMPIWPIATLFFVRSLSRQRVLDSMLLGIFGGIGLLAKYYTAVLLVGFFVASLLHPAARNYWRSSAPYLAAASCALLLAPHLWWLVQHDFAPFTYAASKFNYPVHALVGWATATALGPILFFASAFALLAQTTGLGARRLAASLATFANARENAWLAALIATPYALTLLFGYVGHAKVSLSYTYAIFFLVPIIAMMATKEASGQRIASKLTLCAVVVLAGVAIATPVISQWRVARDVRAAIEPRREVAVLTNQLWREYVGTPLRLVAGTMAYAGSAPFYSPDAPSHFISHKAKIAPWVTPERLRRDGLLSICLDGDRGCLEQAERFASERTIRLTRSFSRRIDGHQGPIYWFTLVMTPPLK